MVDDPNVTRNLLEMYESNNWMMRLNVRLFLKLSGVLSLPRDVKILDCGCGTGNLILALRYLGFTNLIGLDNSTEMVEVAKRLTGVPIYLSDVLDIKKHAEPGSLDVVIISNLIHHITDINDWEKLFESCNRVLNENGNLLIREPWPTIPVNILSYLSKYEFLHRGFLKPHLCSFIEEKKLIDYFFAHWPNKHKALLAKHGFNVTKDFSWLVHRVTSCKKMIS